MTTNLYLFMGMAIAVALVGGFLWWKPRRNLKGNSGVGDQGQKR